MIVVHPEAIKQRVTIEAEATFEKKTISKASYPRKLLLFS